MVILRAFTKGVGAPSSRGVWHSMVFSTCRGRENPTKNATRAAKVT